MYDLQLDSITQEYLHVLKRSRFPQSILCMVGFEQYLASLAPALSALADGTRGKLAEEMYTCFL